MDNNRIHLINKIAKMISEELNIERLGFLAKELNKEEKELFFKVLEQEYDWRTSWTIF